MALITQFDSSISFDVNTGIIDTNNLSLLNAFGTEETVSSYDTEGGDDSLQNGEPLGISTEEGSTLSGTYLGDVTLSTTSPSINLGLVGLSVQLNPIEGELYQADGGALYMISDDPLNDARIGITATVSLLGGSQTFEGSLADLDEWLASIPAVGPLLDTIGDTGQWVLDTAVASLEYDPSGELIVCFVRGSLIETANGPVAVEHLGIGDLIVTRDNGVQEIRWISSTKLGKTSIAKNPNLRPIRIKAGALGENTPSTDLMVSPQHRVLVRSKIAQRMFGTMEVLVAAKQLCLLDGIDIADVSEVEYFHFLFDQHEVVYSNGAETESLYTGQQALKSVSIAARQEIFSLFPQLKDAETIPLAARELSSGRKARKLAMRHLQHGKPLVS